jgi:hypothetical protein
MIIMKEGTGTNDFSNPGNSYNAKSGKRTRSKKKKKIKNKTEGKERK